VLLLDLVNVCFTQEHGAGADIMPLSQVWAVGILNQLWLVLIVAHYVDELFDEEELSMGIDIEGPPPFKMRGSHGQFAKQYKTPFDEKKSARSPSLQKKAYRDDPRFYQDSV
jgi:hypothetical protein